MCKTCDNGRGVMPLQAKAGSQLPDIPSQLSGLNALELTDLFANGCIPVL